MALVAGLGLAAGVRGDEWWIGFGRLNGTYTHPIHDMVNGGFEVGSRDLSQSLLEIGGSVMRSWGGPLELGMSGGVGAPLGSWTIDSTIGEIPPVGMPNKYEGDQLEISAWTVPILIRSSWGAPVGPGRLGLALSAGMLLVIRHLETTNQLWVDTGGIWNEYRFASTDVKYGTEVESSSDVIGVPQASLAPGYLLRIGDANEIGIEVPITWSPKRRISGKEQDLVTPVPTQPDPYQQVAGLEMGGLSFGARAMWRRKF